MIDAFVVAFATFFATVGPLDIAPIFAALTVGSRAAERRRTALRGVAIAGIVLLTFALCGQWLLGRLGISLAALRTAGGVLLLLIAIDMVFARPSGGTGTTADETEEAHRRSDVAVFPLATPLIAGPGAMGAAILLMADAGGDLAREAAILAALAAVLLVALLACLGASQIQRVLGVTGLHVVSRVFGVLLAALAVQYVFDGVAQSGLLGPMQGSG
ncbi:MAG: MarC family protein [Ectothiorhodospiraceae bacterium]|nr:MarC family protein [Chromatiales bacterium]MCP5156559.1 MarC family protein [Ectothiorhodospiraceae bacterium]